MIDFDTSKYPTGVVGWQRLLNAIEGANPADESEWIEFKANVDFSTREHRPVVAKAIVAFANRDPERARQWLDGRALVVIGLEPGNVVGTPVHDPANLHNFLDPLLAPPGPGWDFLYVPYKRREVLVIVVDPPCVGDPIHCIGSNANKVQDGDVYVRNVGKSVPAKWSDIRRLSARLTTTSAPALQVEVAADAGDGVPTCDWPEDWVDQWIQRERHRLMKPFAPPPDSQPAADERRTLRSYRAGRRAVDIYDSGELTPLSAKLTLGEALSGLNAKPFAPFVEAMDPFTTRHDEDRTQAEYESEVEAYLSECRTTLPEAVDALRREVAHLVLFSVRNATDTNFTDLLIRLHIEGDVDAYDDQTEMVLSHHHPRSPRIWGPWTEREDPYAHVMPRFTVPMPHTTYLPRPRPDIVNGGSATIEFPPIDLRPRDKVVLAGDIALSALTTASDSIACTWVATATNVDGQVAGRFTIPLSGEVLDFTARLRHPQS